jgi:tetratricopeptide (TPR) repeat protein
VRKLFLALCSFVVPYCHAASVLVVPFHNASQFTDLNWVGESIADTLTTEFGAANQIVYDWAARNQAFQRLSLRRDADFTKATLIRIGETLDADYICFGSFDVSLPAASSAIKDGVVRIAAHFIDLRKLHDGPDFSETGNLSELWRLQEHLAFQTLQYLEPKGDFKADQFLSPEKAVRADAEESYVRGLLSANREQKQKWFLQAAALDPKFAGPAIELGKLSLEQKRYSVAMNWFRKVPPNDPRYAATQFRMGLAAYGAGDYKTAANQFRELSRNYPLGEIYNNLGVAEAASNQAGAGDDLKKALEFEPSNGTYLYNLGVTSLKRRDYEAAAKQFSSALEESPNDAELSDLLEQAQSHSEPAPGTKPAALRLATDFNETAFRQLKAMIQASK